MTPGVSLISAAGLAMKKTGNKKKTVSNKTSVTPSRPITRQGVPVTAPVSKPPSEQRPRSSSSSRPSSRQGSRPSTRSSNRRRTLKRQGSKPMHPGIFKVLLSKEEMIELIEKGQQEMQKDLAIATEHVEEAEAESLGSSRSDDDADIPDVTDLESTLRTMRAKRPSRNTSRPL